MCVTCAKDGESYELYLTTQMRKRTGKQDPSNLNYLSLGKQNPEPYAGRFCSHSTFNGGVGTYVTEHTMVMKYNRREKLTVSPVDQMTGAAKLSSMQILDSRVRRGIDNLFLASILSEHWSWSGAPHARSAPSLNSRRSPLILQYSTPTAHLKAFQRDLLEDLQA
ncbi:hypothetical protein Ancab_001385 [Ancistrocladus abbreviatus]